MKLFYLIAIFTLIGYTKCEERTFKLKSGDKITGQVINIDDNGNYTIKTPMGEAVFNKDEILLENIKIITIDGDRIIGVLTNEDNEKFYVKTNIGFMSIYKNNIKSVDFNFDDYEDEGFLNNLSKTENRYFFGDEQLIDVWFDPTGNVLPEGTIYISGLSAAYGVTNKFQISLRVWDYIFGDVNFRPKFQIYKKGDIEKSSTLSVGAHFYLTGAIPHKWNLQETSTLDTNNYNRWEKITSDNYSYELFIAHTSSKLSSSDQGRINYNLGLSIAKIDDYPDIMPRLWIGTDIDVRKSLKLTGLVAYDKYLPTISELFYNEEQTDFHIDFGFIYALNDNFRLGLHLTKPFIAFYWKF